MLIKIILKEHTFRPLQCLLPGKLDMVSQKTVGNQVQYRHRLTWLAAFKHMKKEEKKKISQVSILTSQYVTTGYTPCKVYRKIRKESRNTHKLTKNIEYTLKVRPVAPFVPDGLEFSSAPEASSCPRVLCGTDCR